MTSKQLIHGLLVCLIASIIGLWGIILYGCAGNQATIPVCRHYSTLGAVTDAEYWPVRIWWGTSDDPRGHNQHQALIKGEWVWRCVGISSVYSCDRDGFTPIKSYTINEWLDKNKMWAMKGER